jgi:hypothetical protein
LYGIHARGDRGNTLESENASWYGLYVESYQVSSTRPGLYVYGTGHITGGWSKSIPASSGDVTAFSVSSPEVELMASGTGTLQNGKAEIAFDPGFREAISSEIPVKVVLTAQGAPSGLLYVGSKSNQGFTAQRLEIPDLAINSAEISFDWIAVGRQKGCERRPAVLIPSEEDRRDQELKEQEELERHAVHREQMLEKQAQREAERREMENERMKTGGGK